MVQLYYIVLYFKNGCMGRLKPVVSVPCDIGIVPIKICFPQSTCPKEDKKYEIEGSAE
jgi:hypothetical protein